MANITYNKRGFHIAHLNCQSAKNKLDLLKFEIKKLNFDVFMLSETWFNEMLSNQLLLIDGYDLIRLDRSWKKDNEPNIKRGGGVAIYIKSNHDYSTTELDEYNISSNNIEILWITVSNPNQRKTVIGVVYRPPQSSIQLFTTTITELVSKINTGRNRDMFILGDFNINYATKGGQSRKQLKEFEALTNLNQLIQVPTRYSTNNSIIDLIFTNSSNIMNCGTLDLNLGDHEVIFVTRKKSKDKFNIVESVGRSYLNYNKELFQQQLKDHDWTSLNEITDANSYWNGLVSVVREYLDPMCPLKKIKIKNKDDPWITAELIDLIKDKDRARMIAKRTNRNEDWDRAKRLRNLAKMELRRAKSNFITENLSRYSNDGKKFWEQIGYLLPKNKSKSKINLVNHDTKQQILDKNVADYINDFFCNIGPSLASNFGSVWRYHGNRVEDNIQDIMTDELEIIKLCKTIDIYKSSAVSNLSSRVLKDVFLAIPEKIVALMNISLITCTFPDAWEKANVVPLFKGGDRTNVNNFRPVSLLPLPGKLLERIVHSRLINFFDMHNVLNPNQGGFRAGHSTTNTIACFTDDILHLNESECTMAAFIDLCKAFDTVNHYILIKKLEENGIRGNTLNWVRSYLNSRSQCVLANGIISDTRSIVCGVPQGSILGPLMFLIYINDIDAGCQGCSIRLYADDTVMYTSAKNVAKAATDLQRNLDRFAEWCTQNQLTINTKKSKCVLFGSKKFTKIKDLPVIILNNKVLDYVDSYKYLGVTLDRNLNFQQYVREVFNLVSHKIYMLSRIRQFINKDVSLLIYKTKILPYLDYGDILYDGADSKSLVRLQKLQNRALRVCLNSAEPLSRRELITCQD